MDETLSKRVAARYLIRQASYEIARTESFKVRCASLHDFTPEVLAAMGEGFLLDDMMRTAFFGKFRQKLQRVWDFVKRAPEAWKKIKGFFRLKDPSELPKAIREWSKKGRTVLKKVIQKMTETFPFSLYFVDRGKLPGLTDLLNRIVERSPRLKKALSSINKNIVQPLDRLMEKHLPTLGRPLKAAVFIFVWINVAESPED